MQEVVAQMAVCFAVSDNRFDGGLSPQFLLDLSVAPEYGKVRAGCSPGRAANQMFG